MSYWIQVEGKPKGNLTSAFQIDLEGVDRVVIVREDKKPKQLQLGYKKEQVIIDGDGVDYFLKCWHEFIELKQTMPEAEPSIIHAVSDTPLEVLRSKAV